MRTLWRVYVGLTRFFGDRRRFVRRLAGLCLVVLGVHTAADLIDDLVFRIVDQLDLWLDHAGWGVLDALAGAGAFSEAEAAAHGQNFSEWIDLDEKDRLSKILALSLELFVDLLLLDFVWGKRNSGEDDSGGLVSELKASARELRDAFWPLDLERVAVLPILFAFSLAGTIVGALAVESFLSHQLSEHVPLWRFGPNLSASIGLLLAALLVWRFVPDLLHGAILRAHVRGEKAREREQAAGAEAPPPTKLALVRGVVRRATRGAFLFFLVLPIAALALGTQTSFFALIARVGSGL
jgi:hypothetical protein